MNTINCLNVNPKYYQSKNINFGALNPTNAVSKILSIENSGYHPFIQESMKRLAEYEVEHGIIFTRDGRLLKEIIGDKMTIYSSEKVRECFRALAEKNPGWILLHNHPKMDCLGQARPITLADAWDAGYHDASEAIAVHPDYSYSSIKCLPNESKLSYGSIDNFRSLMGDIDLKLYNKYGNVRDKVWKDNAERLGIIYTNTFKY